MSYPVDMVSEFELLFASVGAPSIKNSVQTVDGQIVRLDEALWKASPVLRKQFAEGTSYIVVTVQESSVVDLFNAHKEGNLPQSLSDLWNLFAVSGQLQLRELTSKIFGALCEKKGFSERDYPSECSTQTVMQCFRLLLESPLRTAEIYKQQITRIARHCDDDPGVMSNALNLVKEKLHLFGKHISLESTQMEEFFYLKQGSYVLYKSGSKVYRKDIHHQGEPVEVLSECKLMVPRQNSVFAVRDDGRTDTVLQWINDDSFVQVLDFLGKIPLPKLGTTSSSQKDTNA